MTLGLVGVCTGFGAVDWEIVLPGSCFASI
jgi:hypothetical protein